MRPCAPAFSPFTVVTRLAQDVLADKLRARCARRCHIATLIKPFGDGLSFGDLRGPLGGGGVPDSKQALAEVDRELPEHTTHLSSDNLPAFMGMVPGGVSPFTPKVRRLLKTKERRGRGRRRGQAGVPRAARICNSIVQHRRPAAILHGLRRLGVSMQIILATSKLEAPPLFRLLAANFRRRDVAFGWYAFAWNAWMSCRSIARGCQTQKSARSS